MLKLIILPVISAAYLLLSGCYKTSNLTYEELESFSDTSAVTIITKSQQNFILSKNLPANEVVLRYSVLCIPCSSWTMQADSIILNCAGKYKNYKIGRDDINEITVRKKDNTALGIGVIAGAAVLILLIEWIGNTDIFDFNYRLR